MEVAVVFADACDAGVGFDGDHHVALIEKLVQVRRFVDANPGNLRFGQRSLGCVGTQQTGDRGGSQGAEEVTADHGTYQMPPRKVGQSDKGRCDRSAHFPNRWV